MNQFLQAAALPRRICQEYTETSHFYSAVLRAVKGMEQELEKEVHNE